MKKFLPVTFVCIFGFWQAYCPEKYLVLYEKADKIADANERKKVLDTLFQKWYAKAIHVASGLEAVSRQELQDLIEFTNFFEISFSPVNMKLNSLERIFKRYLSKNPDCKTATLPKVYNIEVYLSLDMFYRIVLYLNDNFPGFFRPLIHKETQPTLFYVWCNAARDRFFHSWNQSNIAAIPPDIVEKVEEFEAFVQSFEEQTDQGSQQDKDIANHLRLCANVAGQILDDCRPHLP